MVSIAGAHGLWLLPVLLSLFGGDAGMPPSLGNQAGQLVGVARLSGKKVLETE